MVLEVEQIIKGYSYIAYTASNFCNSQIFEMYSNGNLIIDFDVFLPTRNKNLQRGLVWSLEKKQAFVLQILKTYKVSGGISAFDKLRVVTNKIEGVTHWQVIDGKQRLNAIIDFYNAKFPINVDGKDYYINQISPTLQGVFNRFWFSIDYALLEDMDDSKKIDWFSVNFLGEPQDVNHYNSLL